MTDEERINFILIEQKNSPKAFLAMTGSDSSGSPTPNLLTPITLKTYSFPRTNFPTVMCVFSCLSETVDQTTLLVSRFSTTQWVTLEPPWSDSGTGSQLKIIRSAVMELKLIRPEGGPGLSKKRVKRHMIINFISLNQPLTNWMIHKIRRSQQKFQCLTYQGFQS